MRLEDLRQLIKFGSGNVDGGLEGGSQSNGSSTKRSYYHPLLVHVIRTRCAALHTPPIYVIRGTWFTLRVARFHALLRNTACESLAIWSVCCQPR